MDEIDIPMRIRQLNSQKVALLNQKKELQIYIEKRQASLKLLGKELKQKLVHFDSLSEYVLLENPQQQLINQSDEEENFDQGILQKKSLEQLNFHMDKYFNYVAESIITNEVQLIGQDNQYNASQVLTILVKIQKTIFPSNELRSRQMVGDDEDFLVNTFRFSKSTTFDQLKEVCLKYWEIINKRNQTDDQMREEEQLRGIKDRFEFTDNEGIVVNHLLVEQYLNLYNQNHDSFSIILRRKKQKIQTRRGDETQRNKQSTLKVATASKIGIASIDRQSQIEDNKSARSSLQQQSQKLISENKSQTSKQSAEQQQTEEEEEDNFEDGPEFQQKIKNKLFLKYYSFFKRFDLIKKMFTLTQEEVEERGRAQEKPNIKKGYGCDDNNICVMVMIFLMLIVNALFLSYLEDGPIMYSHIRKLNDLLNIGAQGQAGSFLDISSIYDLQSYLSNVENGMPYQLMDPKSKFNENYQILGGIRFRQARTKVKNCSSVTRRDIKTQVQCTENYYSDRTKETSLLSDGSKPWQYYKSASFANSSRIVNGQFSSYDQSGYIQDINKDQFSVGSYDRIIIEGMLENEAYFTKQLLSLFVTFAVRCKNDGALFFIELFVEYPSSGIFPNQPKILPFSSYIFGEGDSDPYSIKADINSVSPDNPNNFSVGKKLYGLMIAKVFFGLFQSMFIINQLLHYFRQNMHVFTRYLVSVTFIINCLVVVTNFTCVSEIFNLANQSITTEYLIGLNQYQDLGNQAVLYYSMTNTLGISMATLIIRSYLFLTFFKSFEYIIQTIEQQYLAIATTFSLILSVLAGFTFISQQIWGYYLVNFSTFGRALLSLMLITISLFNQDQLYFYQPIMAMIFMLFFFFFILYFMSNLLAVIYIDSYRLLVLNNGEILPENWNKTDWLNWFLSWAPQKLKDKFIPHKEVSVVNSNSAQTEF